MPTKSYIDTPATVNQAWRLYDAEGKVLGRLATQVATTLRGKDKPTFTPHVDGGDFVVVVNAEKVKLTGMKKDKKMYYSHSGYRGGLKATSARELLDHQPEEVIRRAVWGMLPKGPLGRKMLGKLKIYRGASHPHAAQTPETATHA